MGHAAKGLRIIPFRIERRELALISCKIFVSVKN